MKGPHNRNPNSSGGSPSGATRRSAIGLILGAPLLGIVPHLPGSDPAAAARHLKLPEIRGI